MLEEIQKLCDRLIDIGRRIEERTVGKAFAGLSEEIEGIFAETEEQKAFLPYRQLVLELELEEGERLLVCLLWYLLSEKHTDTAWEEALERIPSVGAQRRRTLPVCFWHHGDRICLSPVTLAFLKGEIPDLGQELSLSFPQIEKCYGIEPILQMGSRMLEWSEKGEQEAAALVLSAEEGSGRHFAAEQIAARAGLGLLTITSHAAVGENRMINEILLCMQLYHAMLCIEYERTQTGVIKKLSGYVPFVILIQDKDSIQYDDAGYALIRQELTLPDVAVKGEIIRDMLQSRKPEAALPDGLTYNMLISKQLPTGKYIRFAQSIRLGLLMGNAVSEKEIHGTASGQLTWLPANRTFEELKLPRQQFQQLEKICRIIKARRRVLSDWGYGRKYKYGNGISVLFYGAPGTGKTMAAQVLANALGMPLFRVDLSQLTSKYIGETQKNIGRIFEEAKRNECMLLFDEADAIFSKRSDISDAQDRYSNAETAYLLQCIEQYDGIAVLATNLLQNFDEAFRRRITYMLHFPMPDAGLRVQLWQSVFPEETRVAAEVDYETLANAFEMSGAAIKNASFHAACCACAEESEVKMRHLLDGIQNEYLKTGKGFNEEQRQLQKMVQEE